MRLNSKPMYNVLYCLCAIVFILFLPFSPFFLSWLIKALPALILAGLSRTHIPGKPGKMLSLGFLFSAAGDIFLELDPDQLFIFGLGTFLVAHLLYIRVFTFRRHLTRHRIILIAGIILYGLILAITLYPAAGDIRPAVMVYLCIITIMGVCAGIGGPNHPFVILGAILFVISDSLIAVNRFLVPIPAHNLMIMITYYTAQWFIATGVLKTHPTPQPPDAHGKA